MLSLRYCGTNGSYNFTWGLIYYGYDYDQSNYQVTNDRGETWIIPKNNFYRC